MGTGNRTKVSGDLDSFIATVPDMRPSMASSVIRNHGPAVVSGLTAKGDPLIGLSRFMGNVNQQAVSAGRAMNTAATIGTAMHIASPVTRHLPALAGGIAAAGSGLGMASSMGTIGGAAGMLMAPGGHRAEGLGRGALAGAGTALGADLGGVAGGVLSAYAGVHPAIGAIGGMLAGGLGGHYLANKAMNRPSWEKDEDKEKRAYGYADDDLELDRYDPVYYGDQFAKMTPQDIAATLTHSKAVAQREGHKFHVGGDRNELGGTDPGSLAKVYQALPPTTTYSQMSSRPDYPHLYAMEYARKKRLFGLLGNKPNPPTEEKNHPVFSALAAWEDSRSGHKPKAVAVAKQTPQEKKAHRVMYHGSPTSNLQSIEPRSSRVLGGDAAVFGTPDRDLAVSYTQPWNDSDFEQGYEGGKPYMREQYAGAFDKVYAGKSGTIYHLPGQGFAADPRLMRHERVSAHAVTPRHTETVADSLAALRGTRFRLDAYGDGEQEKKAEEPIDPQTTIARAGDFSRIAPAVYGGLTATGITGGMLGSARAPRGHQGEGTARGAFAGLGTGAGSMAGGVAGLMAASDQSPGIQALGGLGGALAGGLGGQYLANKAMGSPSWDRNDQEPAENGDAALKVASQLLTRAIGGGSAGTRQAGNQGLLTRSFYLDRPRMKSAAGATVTNNRQAPPAMGRRVAPAAQPAVVIRSDAKQPTSRFFASAPREPVSLGKPTTARDFSSLKNAPPMA